MLPYHWEHYGINIPSQTIKFSDTQVFINTSKTQAWEFLLSPIPDLRLSHCPHIKDKQRS